MKIAVVFPSGHVFDTPCVPSLVQSLARNGVCVDLYVARNVATPDGEFRHPGVKLIEYPKCFKRHREPVISMVTGFVFWFGRQLQAGKYDFVLACGIRGLFVAGILSRIRKFQFAYNSLEIYPRSTIRGFSGALFKKLEITFNRAARFSIIQDDRRADILRSENCLPADHPVQIFPNVPMLHLGTDVPASLRARRAAGVPDGKYLVLVSGSLSASWAGIDEILSGIQELPDDIVVFLQSRSKFTESSGQLTEELAASGKLIVSSKPLSSEQYDALVGAADVGIAWYRSDNPNINFVGLSSGKIAHYLARGVPVIVNKIPLWESAVPEHLCGVVIDRAEDIPEAIGRILAQLEEYRRGALRAYDALFETKNRAKHIALLMRKSLA